MKKCLFTAASLAAFFIFGPAPAIAQIGQDGITFDAPAPADSIVIPAPTWTGSTESLQFIPTWTSTDAHTSIQQWQWQESTNGGTSWTGPDGTSSTYYVTPALSLTFTSGTLEARVRGRSADSGAFVQYSSWTISANTTYTSPASGVTAGSYTNANLTVNAYGLITAASNGSGGSSTPFPAFSSTVTYSTGQVVLGSDGNLYRALGSTTGNAPTADSGVNWELWFCRNSLTLNCGAGKQFPGTSTSAPASNTDPAGIMNALTFVENAVGCAASATITIQVANDPTGTVAGGSSTTSFTSSLSMPVTTVILFTSGANKGKTCAISAVSGSSAPYAYTVGSGYGTTGLSSTPTGGDAFTCSYGYNTNTITVAVPPSIGQQLTILGSTSTPVCPTFYPSLTTAGTGAPAPRRGWPG
ncbi:MAG: hypothetical protein ACLQVD_06410 [Capsulimonadaceae bacterium]